MRIDIVNDRNRLGDVTCGTGIVATHCLGIIVQGISCLELDDCRDTVVWLYIANDSSYLIFSVPTEVGVLIDKVLEINRVTTYSGLNER